MSHDGRWTVPLLALAVDLAILTVREDELAVLLIERGVEPHVGQLALPGGFLATVDEDILAAARRELVEETGIAAAGVHLEQLATYGAPNRDPRQRVVTVCYLALLPDLPLPVPGGDAKGAFWYPTGQILARPNMLAFDHGAIVADAVDRARAKLEYTTVATAFCRAPFTMSDLRRIYEIVWNQKIDARNFHRKILSIPGFVEPTDEQTIRDGGRPAALYRRGPASLIQQPLIRPRAAAPTA